MYIFDLVYFENFVVPGRQQEIHVVVIADCEESAKTFAKILLDHTKTQAGFDYVNFSGPVESGVITCFKI